MDKGWRLILSATIKWIHVCHDTAQLLILDVLGDKGIRRHEEVVGMHSKGIGGRTKIKKISLIGKGEDSRHISL